MKATISVLVLALSTAAAASATKSSDLPADLTEPKIAVQLLPGRSTPRDPLLRHVRVSTPPVTSLRSFCRAISQSVPVPVETEKELADQKVFVEIRDQPLGRVLEDVAALMNARLVREPRDTGPAHYRILQLKAQREAEAAIVGGPVQRLTAGLQALRDGKDPGGLPNKIAQLAKQRPGVVSVLRKLPEAQWEQLLDGHAVPVTDPVQLALLGPDFAMEIGSLRRHAANAGIESQSGAAEVASAFLEVNDQLPGFTPTLLTGIRLSGGGSISSSLIAQQSLLGFSDGDDRLRKLLQIPPTPDPLPDSPEIDLSDLRPELPLWEVAAEIARRGRLEMIVRQFRNPLLPPRKSRVTYDRKAPALELLADIWRHGLLWGKRDGILVMAPSKWPFYRREEIPDEKLDRWLDAARHKKLSVDHIIEMAQLTDPQLLRLQSFFVRPALDAYKWRIALRAWGALNSLQQQAAAGPEGIPIRTLDDAIQQALVPLATDLGARDPTGQPGEHLSVTRSPLEFRIVLSGVGIRETELARLTTPLPSRYYPPTPPGLAGQEDPPDQSRLPEGTQTKSQSF